MGAISAAAQEAAEVCAREHTPGASPSAAWMQRFFPLYCVLLALVTFGYARYDQYQLDGDAVAYMDIGDLLRAHRWAGIVNGYWHPMYPALLSLGHILFHATRANELRAYYLVNYGIFLLEMLAMVAFTDALASLRQTMANDGREFLCSKITLRYAGLALLTIASQRELSLGKVRPDALLQAFLLFAVAALLRYFATERMVCAVLMGLALGCAYLTKSFAFVLTFLCLLMLVAFARIWLRRSIASAMAAALAGLICFGAIAGPYIAALSRQHGRFDVGDSGSLNYAWYVGGTRKMHLEAYMTPEFGSAEVHLKHPERELMRSPQVLSYAQLPYGTYPDWFDTTFWNDQVKPHFALRGQISRGARNCVLVIRYLFNHPESLLLFALLLVLGARPALRWRPSDSTANTFWLPPLLLGAMIWGIYAVVNTEERYVTVAFVLIMLSLYASLRLPKADAASRRQLAETAAPVLVLLLALLAGGESLRTVFQARRDLSGRGVPGGWYSPRANAAAEGLKAMGVEPGDQIACAGWKACLDDQYWARLAGARILTEIYAPDTDAYSFLAGLGNRDEVIATVRAQGPKVLVADFATARVSDADPFFRQWRQLGDTTLYALPLNLH
ncbi:MAG TPA: hypothetical protein VN612_10590 [Acidobacteriaceae bacterium]|nr:hypothetical protein [Acidobacteriaceae bacterium]